MNGATVARYCSRWRFVYAFAPACAGQSTLSRWVNLMLFVLTVSVRLAPEPDSCCRIASTCAASPVAAPWAFASGPTLRSRARARERSVRSEEHTSELQSHSDLV